MDRLKNKQRQQKGRMCIREAKDVQNVPNQRNQPLSEGFPSPPECDIKEDPPEVYMPPAKFEPISEPEPIASIGFDLCTFCSMVYQKAPTLSHSHPSVDDEYHHRRLRMEFVLAKEIDPTKAAKCCDRCWEAFDAFCDFKMRCDAALTANESSEGGNQKQPVVKLIVKSAEPGQEEVCFEVTDLHTEDPSLENPMEKQYECDTCGKRYQNYRSLHMHAAKHGDPQFPCGTCGKAFHYRQALQSHLHVHSDEKKYQCMECGKFFKHQTSHRIHQRIHTGEKLFTCQVCNRRFNYRRSLKDHAAKCKPVEDTRYDQVGGLSFLL